MSRDWIRRSFLYVPGNSEKMIRKSWKTEADSIIFDLEDAVNINDKVIARDNVYEAIFGQNVRRKEVIVRVNTCSSINGIYDILKLTGCSPDAFIIPKADVKSLIVADNLLEAREIELNLERGNIKLIPLIETTSSIVDLEAILKTSARINGVQLGAEDLTKEQGIERTNKGNEIFYARNILAYTACSKNIDIIDTPFTTIKDIEGLKIDTQIAKNIGFTGKTCIHPDHIEIINSMFSPLDNEVLLAKKLVEVFDKATMENRSVIVFEGKMVDNPIVERSRKIIEKANKINN